MPAGDFSALILRSGREGVFLEVRARPGARRPGLAGVHGGALKVALKSPPEGGKANDELIALLADSLGLRRERVMLVRGAASRSKSLLIAGIDEAGLRARLAAG